MVKKKRVDEETTLIEPAVVEATSPNKLKACLEEIRNYEGVTGYILRNTTSAAIDLNDPTKIIDCALLSSTAAEASAQLSEFFKLGEPSNIIVEGKKAKMLSLAINENKIAIFMEKNADHEKILKRLFV
ncbi:MAG: hypothetical protein QHH24_06915 [Candidatus Bathyarchaeota archaeon]|nr:hypothetical protein [Candidatus Bathyarchaeota archaeon]